VHRFTLRRIRETNVPIAESSINSTKAELRREAITRRDALPADARAAAAETLASRPLPLPIAPGAVVSGFMPLGSEINPVPLMKALAGQGARLALPVIAGRGKPLTMRSWNFGDELDRGQWNFREPKPEAAEVEPDILLVPLLAFDRTGHRIGYGAGYYDLTIARLRAQKPIVTIGLAFAAQEVRSVPATPRDARLDLVLTENEVIDLREG
jgi:5-formyltetrahydrofolate cyclo-ligase